MAYDLHGQTKGRGVMLADVFQESILGSRPCHFGGRLYCGGRNLQVAIGSTQKIIRSNHRSTCEMDLRPQQTAVPIFRPPLVAILQAPSRQRVTPQRPSEPGGWSATG